MLTSKIFITHHVKAPHRSRSVRATFQPKRWCTDGKTYSAHRFPSKTYFKIPGVWHSNICLGCLSTCRDVSSVGFSALSADSRTLRNVKNSESGSQEGLKIAWRHRNCGKCLLLNSILIGKGELFHIASTFATCFLYLNILSPVFSVTKTAHFTQLYPSAFQLFLLQLLSSLFLVTESCFLKERPWKPLSSYLPITGWQKIKNKKSKTQKIDKR